MRKRSRRRSRRRSSRRGRGKQGLLTRRLGVMLVLGLLGVSAWLLFSDSEQGVTPEQKKLGIDVVAEAQSTEAKAERRATEQAMLQEAKRALADVEGKSGPNLREAKIAAYHVLAGVLGQSMSVETRAKLIKPFNEITDEIFFSAERNQFSKTYIVKSGDNIGDIAKTFGVTQELLCAWNEIPWERRARINIGQSLKVIDEPVSLRLQKSEFCLSFYFGDMLARQFIVAHGRNNGTPVGDAVVINKRVDPDIGENLPPNLLEMDERWIGFSPIDGRTGIGIHGTKHEDQVPGESSLGCIRMFNSDVVKLYDWVPEGTKFTSAA